MSFKKDLYTEIVRVLNIPKTVVFKGGYLIGLYQNGIPYVVDQTTDSKFDYTRKKVVPVSEEIAQETPSVNLADRSDYIFQYKIMFQSNREDEILTALDAFRTYFFTNKQLTVDGYTVSIKTSRGDKLGTRPHAGFFWTFYTIKVFATAIKTGTIWADTDTWSLRLKDTGDYETLKLTSDIFSNVGTATFSNATGTSKGLVSFTNSNSKISFFYNATAMELKVYQWIMNKLDKDTLFDFKHVFKGVTYSYVGLIVGGARTRTDNGVIILEFDWIEADV